MCFSTNAIEQQAYRTALKIREHSIYKFVRAQCTNGDIFDFENPSAAQVPVITMVILEDKSGNLYSVEPNYVGLKFAKGDMNYKEYKKIQKKEMAKGLGVFFMTTGIYFSISFAVIRLMI
ncbi:hypothetical protein AWH48_16665 [Domibacillus aminovorans]|uniref:Uncharacterized protein n=1 Tax=Domibacillus aminovorans TaxID=29332 RepID=A0A177KZ61_9BACI|nr:hypothetical protein [Domibacillus aminovorans]OAH58633.1 hypothetical protein AWH48_16665 [Domibacillus aminovorans]